MDLPGFPFPGTHWQSQHCLWKCFLCVWFKEETKQKQKHVPARIVVSLWCVMFVFFLLLAAAASHCFAPFGGSAQLNHNRLSRKNGYHGRRRKRQGQNGSIHSGWVVHIAL